MSSKRCWLASRCLPSARIGVPWTGALGMKHLFVRTKRFRALLPRASRAIWSQGNSRRLGSESETASCSYSDVCPSQPPLRYGYGQGTSLVVVINCTKSSIATSTTSVISMRSASPRSTGGSGLSGYRRWGVDSDHAGTISRVSPGFVARIQSVATTTSDHSAARGSTCAHRAVRNGRSCLQSI